MLWALIPGGVAAGFAFNEVSIAIWTIHTVEHGPRRGLQQAVPQLLNLNGERAGASACLLNAPCPKRVRGPSWRQMQIALEFYRNNPPGRTESYFSRRTPEFEDVQAARDAVRTSAEALHMEARYIIIQPGRMKPEHWALGDDGAWSQVK